MVHCRMLHNAICWGDWDGRHANTGDYKALLWLAKGGWEGIYQSLTGLHDSTD